MPPVFDPFAPPARRVAPVAAARPRTPVESEVARVVRACIAAARSAAGWLLAGALVIGGINVMSMLRAQELLASTAAARDPSVVDVLLAISALGVTVALVVFACIAFHQLARAVRAVVAEPPPLPAIAAVLLMVIPLLGLLAYVPFCRWLLRVSHVAITHRRTARLFWFLLWATVALFIARLVLNLTFRHGFDPGHYGYSREQLLALKAVAFWAIGCTGALVAVSVASAVVFLRLVAAIGRNCLQLAEAPEASR